MLLELRFPTWGNIAYLSRQPLRYSVSSAKQDKITLYLKETLLEVKILDVCNLEEEADELSEKELVRRPILLPHRTPRVQANIFVVLCTSY